MRSALEMIAASVIVVASFVLVSALLVACEQPLNEHVKTDNGDYDLALLFTHDGCRVYRFRDNGHAHYWTDCRGQVLSETTRNCGKGCTRIDEDNVETER